MWDQEFESTLRLYLPFIGPDTPLRDDTNLRDSGLDSLAMVELLVRLENDYSVRFADEAMSMETFATTQTLWSTLTKMRGASV